MQKQTAGVKPKPAPTGNRRNPHTHKAIIKATLDLLKTVHYHSLTIEAVAARAGVGKATVYRWWPSKGALVAEAISSSASIKKPRDTGDLPADLVAAANVSVNSYSNNPGGALITALATDLVADPGLLESFVTQFILPGRNALRDLLQRAIDEGLIAPGIDPDLIMDMWAGAIIYRKLMAQRPTDDQSGTRLVDAFLLEKRTPAVRARREVAGASGSQADEAAPSARTPRSISAKRRNSSGDSRKK